MCEGLSCALIWLETPETSKASFCYVADEIYTFRKKVDRESLNFVGELLLHLKRPIKYFEGTIDYYF